MKTFLNSKAFGQVRWQTVIVVGLALALGLNILFGRTSLREAKKLTRDLELRIDTLEAVEVEYQALEKRYDDLYAQFSETRMQISEFKEKLAKISAEQTASVSNIKNELNTLIETYDSIDLNIPLDTTNLDSLKF